MKVGGYILKVAVYVLQKQLIHIVISPIVRIYRSENQEIKVRTIPLLFTHSQNPGSLSQQLRAPDWKVLVPSGEVFLPGDTKFY